MTINIELTELIVFSKVVEIKSFSKAAVALNMSKASVSKKITNLEYQLKTKLINRTTRNLSLTEIGYSVYEYSKRIANEVNELDQVVTGLQRTPQGILRISSSVAFGNLQLSKLLPEFLARYPEIVIDVGLNDRYINMAEEGYDVSVRLANNPGDTLVARKLCKNDYILCASYEYLSRNGIPKTPSDLERHNFLQLGNMQRSNYIEISTGLKVPISGNLTMNSSESLRASVMGGLGIALLPSYAVGADIKQGNLQQLLSNYEFVGPFGDSIYVVWLPNRYISTKVRVFIDFLVETISPVAPWQAR